MTALNLTATTPEQKTLLKHLTPQVGEVLADKINNGVRIQKDGKTLINKKDLNTFMQYANSEARKLAAKGAKELCVDGDIIIGWAIHYFEEESIEGKLYNEDGTEYKPAKPIKQNAPTLPTYTPPPPKPKPQLSIFDMLDEPKTPSQDVTDEEETIELPEQENDNELAGNADTDYDPTIDEIADYLQKAVDEKNGVTEEKKVNPFYKIYTDIQAQHPDNIIAYRLGDFYEIMGENAAKIAAELDLTLTGRDCGLDERVPMLGFPYQAANTYIQKLIQRGYKVTIVESENQIIDYGTGEVLNTKTDTPKETTITDETIIKLSDIIGNIFIVR